MLFRSSARVGVLAAVLAAVLAPREGRATNFLHVGEATQAEVRTALARELADPDVAGSRLARLEAALNSTFAALPKEAGGKLGHQAIRYALLRFFMQRSGWFIRGLEPSGAEYKPPEELSAREEEWVPNFLQGLLEHTLGGRGVGLHELAALAAALDDLISHEARERLQAVYETHEIPSNTSTRTQETQELVGTYFIQFFRRGRLEANNTAELRETKERMGRRGRDFPWAQRWANETLAPYFGKGEQVTYGFGDSLRMAEDLGRRYHEHYYEECDRLSSVLHGLEGQQEGRVRLSVFYKAQRFSHWVFMESADYLRGLGALDDSDPVTPSLIITNYVLSRPNCVESTHIYGICCQNKCNDLMSKVESAFGQPEVPPTAIAELIASLPSETVAAPRNLSASLLARLEQVADVNGGAVPLHGRLFAQWMHHAYSRECPNPAPKGMADLQTPEEWRKRTGQLDVASAEEMAKVMADDVCLVDDGGAPRPSNCGNSALPWNEGEELLSSKARDEGPPSTVQPEAGADAWSRRERRAAQEEAATPQAECNAGKGLMILILLAAGALLVPLLAALRPQATAAPGTAGQGRARGASELAACAFLAFAPWAANLASASVPATGFCCAVAVVAAGRATTRLSLTDAADAKCLV